MKKITLHIITPTFTVQPLLTCWCIYFSLSYVSFNVDLTQRFMTISCHTPTYLNSFLAAVCQYLLDVFEKINCMVKTQISWRNTDVERLINIFPRGDWHGSTFVCVRVCDFHLTFITISISFINIFLVRVNFYHLIFTAFCCWAWYEKC